MSKRKLTVGEQEKLLTDLYEKLYNEDGDFHGENVAGFRDDATDGEETEDATNEDDIDFDADEIFPNLDTDIPNDEIALPRKQKFPTQTDVCDVCDVTYVTYVTYVTSGVAEAKFTNF